MSSVTYDLLELLELLELELLELLELELELIELLELELELGTPPIHNSPIGFNRSAKSSVRLSVYTSAAVSRINA